MTYPMQPPMPSYEELAQTNLRLRQLVEDARAVISRQQGEIGVLTQPPNAIGIFQRWDDTSTIGEPVAVVTVGNRDFRVRTVREAAPVPGQQVFLNDAQVLIGTGRVSTTGVTGTVLKTLDDGRVLAATEMTSEMVLERAETVADALLEEGATVLVDPASHLVLELLEAADEVDRLWLEEVPDITYEDIGGLDDQLDKIRDAIELPFLHPELYAAMHLRAPKGILLYGPPGTGKTMIAKAVANQLAKPGRQSHFLSVKGPELLSKWVGESERAIRDIFDRARHLATEGDPVIVFFDEMDATFRTRGSGISSDVEATLVPQLLTELDGMEELRNVIVIGASNRQDLIDPAILRPGRLDIKIPVGRPDRSAAIDIFDRYLTDDLPYAAEHQVPGHLYKLRLGVLAADELFAKRSDTEFLEVTYTKGDKETLHFGDFASGAMIANIVSRAKTAAIKDHVDRRQPLGIRLEHLTEAIREEFKENEDLPNTTSPEDWARISGFKGEDIARVRRIFREASKDDEAETVSTGQYL